MSVRSTLKRWFPFLKTCKGMLAGAARDVKVSRCQVAVGRNVRRLASRPDVRVAFLVVFDSCFHFRKLFELMLADRLFDPYVVVIPAMNQPMDAMKRFYNDTYEYLRGQYGDRVVLSWDGDTCPDISDRYDMFVLLNSYDGLTHRHYGVEWLAKKGKAAILSNYGYDGGTRYMHSKYCRMRNLSYLWRYYAGTAWLKDLLEKNQPTLRRFKRVVLSGVPKMDPLSDAMAKPRHRPRKRVLLCPHHSIPGSSEIAISNFLEYKDMFLELPTRYPDVDWVFRPHPLLSGSLCRCAGWKAGEWEAYVGDFCSNANASYVPGGDCFDLFADSDAMIQDCSSFLGEYLCTGKPQCYILRNEASAREQFDEWGLEMLSHTYRAFSRSDVLRFVDAVVVNGDDAMSDSRRSFVGLRMLHNYPHVNEWILDDIKRAIWMRREDERSEDENRM